jgi:hypothetical protein
MVRCAHRREGLGGGRVPPRVVVLPREPVAGRSRVRAVRQLLQNQPVLRCGVLSAPEGTVRLAEQEQGAGASGAGEIRKASLQLRGGILVLADPVVHFAQNGAQVFRKRGVRKLLAEPLERGRGPVVALQSHLGDAPGVQGRWGQLGVGVAGVNLFEVGKGGVGVALILLRPAQEVEGPRALVRATGGRRDGLELRLGPVGIPLIQVVLRQPEPGGPGPRVRRILALKPAEQASGARVVSLRQGGPRFQVEGLRGRNVGRVGLSKRSERRGRVRIELLLVQLHRPPKCVRRPRGLLLGPGWGQGRPRQHAEEKKSTPVGNHF